MKGLLAHYPSHQGPAVLAGDFNTWVREHREPAYTEARRVFPHPRSNDPGPTHHFELGGVLRRSDHMMARLPDGWTMTVERGPETFGSDHYPLIGRLSLRS